MALDGKKSPHKEANRLSMLLRMALGEDRFPIDVQQLALEVSKNNEDPIEKAVGGDLPGFEGMLRAHRKRPAWHIVYNEEPRYRGRERFTVAHELGHYMLHRPKLGLADYPDGQLGRSCDFQCLPLQSNAWKAAEKQREEEADTFASYLLMPLDDYRRQVNPTGPIPPDFGGEHRAELIRPKPDGFVADINAAFVQQVLDVSKRKRKANIDHHRQADDLRAGSERSNTRPMAGSPRQRDSRSERNKRNSSRSLVMSSL